MTCVIDISLLQFGQLSIVGTTEHARLALMTLPFARQNVGAAKRLTLDWVPVSLKSRSWNWLGRFATAARSHCAPIVYKTRAKKETGKVLDKLPDEGLHWRLVRYKRERRPGASGRDRRHVG